MIENIELLISQLESINKDSLILPAAPSIIKSLKHIRNILISEPPDHKALMDEAYGLGRAVMDDYYFAESTLGNELMGLSTSLLKKGCTGK